MSLSLQDLANLILIRNHLDTLNNINITTKDEYRPILKKIAELDRKIIDNFKTLNLDELNNQVEKRPSVKATTKEIGKGKKKKGKKAYKKTSSKEEPKAEKKNAGHDDPEIAEALAKAKESMKTKNAV